MDSRERFDILKRAFSPSNSFHAALYYTVMPRQFAGVISVESRSAYERAMAVNPAIRRSRARARRQFCRKEVVQV